MSQSIPPGTIPADGSIAALGAWPALMVQGVLQMQRLQWEALRAWQQAFVDVNEEFWEEWACRFAGGLPIDA